MILPEDQLPLHEGVPALNTDWLRNAITSAASKAGYPGWWLAEDLANGISLYLRASHLGPSIDRPQLERVVRGVLCDVGYGEVAMFFRSKIPSRSISLKHCARRSNESDRSEFFGLLADQILGLQNSDVVHLHFSGLQACVRLLLRIPASQSCDEHDHLMHEVVEFVREKVLSSFQRQEVWCSIT